MDVPSYVFLGFVAIVAAVINISSKPAWRRGVFFVANIVFVLLITHDALQLLPFAGFLAAGFICLLLMERVKQAPLYFGCVAAVLFLFCWLKHYSFVPHGLFLPFAYFTVGISYVFFRVMHLIIDARDGALPNRVNLVSYLSYTLNFTCLFSGPIQLYQDYVKSEVQVPAPLTVASAGEATYRIVTGFFKVAVVSALLYYVQTRCLSAVVPGMDLRDRVLYGSLVLAVYPLYLYYNFSGYTDFVIGAARFMRLELPENFRAPFFSEGFMEFWNRWHMTLSNWLKRYVYTPLLMGLMRRMPAPGLANGFNVFAYFVTFFLIGLWHGQTPMFFMYGVFLGLGVSANKLYQIVMIKRLGRAGYRALCARPLYRSASRGLTYAWFAFSLLWFWASWPQLAGLAAQLGAAGTLLASATVWVVSAAILSLLVMLGSRMLRSEGASGGLQWNSIYVRTALGSAMAVLIVSVTVILNAPAPAIVYKAF